MFLGGSWLLAFLLFAPTIVRCKPPLLSARRNDALGFCLGWVIDGLLNGFENSQPPSFRPDDRIPNQLIGPNPEALAHLTPEEKRVVQYLHYLQQLEREKSTVQRYPVPAVEKPTGDQPGKQFVVDTGENFDRFLIHEVGGVDALGLPLYDKTKSTGVIWGNGNLQFVNANTKNLLGNAFEQTNHGFNIPFFNVKPTSPVVSDRSASKRLRQSQRSQKNSDLIDWTPINRNP